MSFLRCYDLKRVGGRESYIISIRRMFVIRKLGTASISIAPTALTLSTQILVCEYAS